MACLKSKTRSQLLHSKRRGEKRFGLNLSNDDIKDIVFKIRMGHAIKITRQSNNMAIYLVRYDNRVLPVVYNRSHHSIATILPKTDPRVRKALNPKPPRKVGSKYYVNHNGNGSKNGKNNGHNSH